MSSFWGFLAENLETFYSFTGVANATPGHLIMILVGLLFIFLAIRYEFEPNAAHPYWLRYAHREHTYAQRTAGRYL